MAGECSPSGRTYLIGRKNRVKPAATATVSTDTERPWWDRAGEAVLNQFKDFPPVNGEHPAALLEEAWNRIVATF